MLPKHFPSMTLKSFHPSLDALPTAIGRRSSAGELFLLKLRLVSVVLGRGKTSSHRARRPLEERLARLVSEKLARAEFLPFARRLLAVLYEVWMRGVGPGEAAALGSAPSEEAGAAAVGGQPDLAPFFHASYVREYGGDLFRAYHQLLSEMALRLPYQIRKLLHKVQPAVVK